MKPRILYPLPDGLFTHFQGMRRGTFDYKLDLNSQKKQPDQLTAI
jgi:hypothetical protein